MSIDIEYLLVRTVWASRILGYLRPNTSQNNLAQLDNDLSESENKLWTMMMLWKQQAPEQKF